MFLKGFLRGKRLLLVLGVLALAIVLFAVGGQSTRENEEDGIDAQIAELCSSIDGVGECYVTVVFADDNTERVYSVAVVCEGGDSVRVKAAVTELITSLFGIGANRVSVMKLKN